MMTSASGVITSATPASLSGVRLMFVVGVWQLANSMRFFGRSAGAETWRISVNLNASGAVIQGSYITGTTTVLTPTPRIMLPASGYVLIEAEFTPTQWLTWINGAAAAGTNSGVSDFMISNIGTGEAAGGRFLGPMGDVAGVLTGRPDTAAAIAAVKASLNAKFGTPT